MRIIVDFFAGAGGPISIWIVIGVSLLARVMGY